MQYHMTVVVGIVAGCCVPNIIVCQVKVRIRSLTWIQLQRGIVYYDPK